jgi:hypothetical protein
MSLLIFGIKENSILIPYHSRRLLRNFTTLKRSEQLFQRRDFYQQ